MLNTKVLAVVLGITGLGSTLATAAVIVDASTRNGDFELADDNGPVSNGGWGNGASYNPLDWDAVGGPGVTGSNPWNVGATPMIYYTSQAFNNTGVTVATGQIFTVNADAEAVATGGAYVDVIATQNANGTGTSVVLATATLADGTQGGPNYGGTPTLIPMVAGVSLPADVSVNGYYVQVRTRSSVIATSNYYWIDNVVVTSEIPEPASMGLLLAGGLLAMRRRAM